MSLQLNATGLINEINDKINELEREYKNIQVISGINNLYLQGEIEGLKMALEIIKNP